MIGRPPARVWLSTVHLSNSLVQVRQLVRTLHEQTLHVAVFDRQFWINELLSK